MIWQENSTLNAWLKSTAERNGFVCALFHKSLKKAKQGDEIKVIFLKELLENQDNMRFSDSADEFYSCDVEAIRAYLANGAVGSPVCMLYEDYLNIEVHCKNEVKIAVASLFTLGALILAGAVLLLIFDLMSFPMMFSVMILSSVISLAVSAFYPFGV